MALDAFVQRSTEPEEVIYRVRMLGTGASTPTKLQGKGVTLGRTGVGVYTVTFNNIPGEFQGLDGFGFNGGTPLNLAGCTVVVTTPASSTTTLVYTITVYAGGTTPAARELAATEVLTFGMVFERTTV